ncbi:MAG: sigma-54-dependent transcriptional regulator [Candidatus Methylomirabilales bacterium]
MKPAGAREPSLLIVDDEPSARLTLSILLKRAGYRVDEAAETGEAIRRLEHEPYDLVVTDLRMAGDGGIEVLKAAKKVSPRPEVIVLTAYGSIGSAVEAMKLGAVDYVAKPFEPEEMLLTIQKALERRRLLEEVRYLRDQVRERYSFDTIVAKSVKLQKVLETASQVAKTDATVLIQGESGTGKEVIARAIHAWSPRAGRPFIAIDCATLPESLLESELFGHVKGAFTGALGAKKGLFEEGDGGTIFLDEVGGMPPSTQAKLLRVLQEQVIRRVGSTTPVRIDIRILAATNQDLKGLVENGTFREDVYYRLNGIVLPIPPLRERREDVIALATHFLKLFGQRLGRKVKGISSEAMEGLVGYAWPGNVRELEKAIERAVVLGRSELLMPDDLPPSLLGQGDLKSSPPGRRMTLAELEEGRILSALYDHGWNQTKAAEELGISRTTLWRKLKEYQITPPS